jgi:polyisoprenoid-binding protein YceI
VSVTEQIQVQVPPAGTYAIDPAHTSVGFVARHLIGSKVRGHFSEFAGTVTIADPPEGSSVVAEASVASVDTGQGQRDAHLRSADFFDAEHYPTISLTSTGLSRRSDTDWTLSTDLTVRGVTRPVDWDLEFLGAGSGMTPDSTVIAFSASADIDRRDFEVSFNHALADSTLVVGNKVRLELEVEAHLAPGS